MNPELEQQIDQLLKEKMAEICVRLINVHTTEILYTLLKLLSADIHSKHKLSPSAYACNQRRADKLAKLNP